MVHERVNAMTAWMTKQHYTGLTLDRASSRRRDPAWVTGLLAEPDTQVIPLWRDQCLIHDDTPVSFRAGHAREVLAAAGETVLLGLDGSTAAFAVDLSRLEQAEVVELTGAVAAVDLRSLVATLPMAEAGLLAYARGILHWNRNQQFCGACGGPTDPEDGGHLRTCRACGRLLFPRIEPAVIVLVELPGKPKRCLLGRHGGAGPDHFCTLAGFVEIGESLEDAVRREVVEEAGVTVDTVTYQASQAWPFPSGLMIGFRAVAVSEQINVDGAELVEARWFTTADLHTRMSDPATTGLHQVDSIDRFLVQRWLADVD